MNNLSACFFGHRKIQVSDDLLLRLRSAVEQLVARGVTTFLFGSKSQFDDLCYDVVTQIKQTHPEIKRIYVRAEFPYIDDSYRAYLLKRYEDTFYPDGMEAAGKAAYVERNHYMIDNSSICIVYYDENYAPPRRKESKRALTSYQPKSGTKLAYDYACKKEKEIINLAN